jgi:hypothetical protein
MAVILIYSLLLQLSQLHLRRECRTTSHKFSNGQNFKPIVILVYNPSWDHIHAAKAGTGFDAGKLHSMRARVDPDTLEPTSLSTVNIDHCRLISSLAPAASNESNGFIPISIAPRRMSGFCSDKA